MYVVCRHAKLKSLVTSIALHLIRGADTGLKQEQVSTIHNIECTCKTQWYTIAILGLVILGLMIFVVINVRKLKLFRGHIFSNAVKIMLFILDTQYYVPVKLCRTVGSIQLFKITGKLTPEQITLKRNITMEHYRNRYDRSQYDFEWEQSAFTQFSHHTTKRQIQN